MVKKVVFIIGGLRGGGAERVCINLANELAGDGLEVRLAVLNLRDQVYLADVDSKVQVDDLGVSHVRYAFAACYRYIVKTKPDVVLSFSQHLSVILIILRLSCSFKFRLVSRCINYLSKLDGSQDGLWNQLVVRKAIQYIYPKSDLVIAQSQAMKVDLINYLGIPERKVTVINNPIDRRFFSLGPSRDSGRQHLEEPFILCVGRLEPQKNFGLAIQAFSLINNVCPKVRLKIVGKGSMMSSLQRLAVSLGLENLVDFEGFQEDVGPYYCSARLTLLTSEYEGFPNVLIESIGVGTPVVSVDCPSGPKEIVVPGGNGYLAKASVQGVAEKLEMALSRDWDPSLVRETALKFDPKEIASQYRKVLEP